MLSSLEDTPKRSIAFLELRHDEMLITLRLTASHTTKHGHLPVVNRRRRLPEEVLSAMFSMPVMVASSELQDRVDILL